MIDDTCMRADALATAFMVMGSEDGLALADREQIAALFLVRDGDQFIERPSAAFEQRFMPGQPGS